MPNPPQLGVTERNSRRGNLMVWAGLFLIIALAAHLRIQAALQTVVDRPLRTDAGEYFRYAYNLKHFGIYSGAVRSADPNIPLPPDAKRNPGYPLFLSLFIGSSSLNVTLLNVVVVQALMGVVTVAVSFALAWTLAPAWAALGAAFLTAISPQLVNASVYILTEALFALSITLTLWLLIRARLHEQPWAAIASGAMLGWSTLVRPTTVYFPVLVAALLLLHCPRRPALRASALLLLGMGVVYGPWVLRNVSAIGSPSDTSLQVAALHHGLYPDFMYDNDPDWFGYPYRRDPRGTEIGASMASVKAEILRRFTEEPFRHLKWYLLGKPYYLWSWEIPQQEGEAFIYPVIDSPYFKSDLFSFTYLLAAILHWPAVLSAAAFCLMAWLRSPVTDVAVQQTWATRVCSATLLYVTLLHMIGAPFPRYSVPFQPVLYAAAFGALHLAHMRLTGRAKARP